MHLGFIEATERLSATDSPVQFEIDGAVDESRNAVIVSSDVAIHIERNADASADSMRLSANTIAKLGMWGADTLSFVKAAGEADGNVFVTRTDS